MKQKFFNKLFCLILSFAMIFSQMAIGFADTEAGESATETGEGIAMSQAFDKDSKDWIRDAKNENHYTISTVDDWLAFAACVTEGNTLSGKTVELKNDIDFSNYTMEIEDAESESGKTTIQASLLPVGTMTATSSSKYTLTPFSGVFEGNGHKLENVLLDDSNQAGIFTDTQAVGLFSCLKDASVQNLIVSGKIKIASYGTKGSGFGGVGTVAGHVEGKTEISNVKSSCDIEVTHSNNNVHAGGIAGFTKFQNGTDITYRNLEYSGKLSVVMGKAGGIEGYAAATSGNTYAGKMTGCVNKGTLSGSKNRYALGYNAKYYNTLSACCNTASDVQMFNTVVAGSLSEAHSLLTTNQADTKATYMSAEEIDSYLGAWTLNQSTAGNVFTYSDEKGLSFADEDTAQLYRISIEPYEGETSEISASVSETSGALYEVSKGGKQQYFGNADMQLTVALTGKAADAETNTAAVYPVYTECLNANGDAGFGENRLNDNKSKTELSVNLKVSDKNIRIRYGTAADYEAAPDYTWYSQTASVYELKTVGQLRGFRDLVNGGNDFKGKTVSLGADIDVSLAEDWTPIGTSKTAFAGTFKGNEHTITYRISSNQTETYRSLFGYIDGAAIEKLTVAGENKAVPSLATCYSAGLVSSAKNSTISDCTNKAEVNCDAKNYAAGIVAYAENSKILNCTNEGNISGTQNIGGIVSNLTKGSTLIACINKGMITASKNNAGGIVGYSATYNASSKISIKKCTNEGKISGAGTVGGIISQLSSQAAEDTATISECINKGEISSTGNIAGGIVGRFSGYMSRCTNEGKVSASGKEQVGGIAGTYDGLKAASGKTGSCIEYCRNKGDISGSDYIGGLIGKAQITTEKFIVNIAASENTGSVTYANTKTHYGGIVGGTTFNNYKVTTSNITGSITYTNMQPVGADVNYVEGTGAKNYNAIYSLQEENFNSSVTVKSLNSALGENFWGYNPNADGCKVIFDGYEEYPVIEIRFKAFDEISESKYTDLVLSYTDSGTTVNVGKDDLSSGNTYLYYDINRDFSATLSIKDSEGNFAKCMVATGEGVSANPDSLTDADNVSVSTAKNNIIVYYGDEESFENFIYDDWYTADENVFTIYTAGQLKSFANIVNSGKSFKKKTVKLAKNIDVSAICGEGKASWQPIGADADYPFAGTFDGNGKTISGIYIDAQDMSKEANVGFFGNLSGAVIKDVTIADSKIKDTKSATPVQLNSVGILVGKSAKAELLIENVTIADNVSLSVAAQTVGGIIGYLEGTDPQNATDAADISIRRCVNNGKLTLIEGTSVAFSNIGVNTATSVGGIIGQSKWGYQSIGGNVGEISFCCNSGTVTNNATSGGDNAAGGIIGYAYSSHSSKTNSTSYLTISLCYNTGEITASEQDSGYAAGIVGLGTGTSTNGTKKDVYTTDISKTFNTGAVSANKVGNILTYKSLNGSLADKSNYYIKSANEGKSFVDEKQTIEVSAISATSGALAYLLDEGASGVNRLFNFTQTAASAIPMFINSLMNPVYKITVNVSGIPESDDVPVLDEKLNDFVDELTTMEIGSDAKSVVQYITKSKTESKKLSFKVNPPEGYILSTVTGTGIAEDGLVITDTEQKNKTTGEISLSSEISVTIAPNADLTLNIEYIPMPEDYGADMTIVLDGNAGEETVWTDADGSKTALELSFKNGDRLTEEALNAAIAKSGSSLHRNKHKFTKWYRDAECTVAYSFNQIMTGYTTEHPLTVYAGWEEVDYVLIKLNANGSEDATARFADTLYADATADKTIYELEAPTETAASELATYTPQREGYTFAGWFYDDESHMQYTEESLQEDAVLYAAWLAADECMVTFDADGGYFTSDDVKSSAYVVKIKKAVAAASADIDENENTENSESGTETMQTRETAAADKLSISELGIPTPKRDMAAAKAYTFKGWTSSKGSEVTISEFEVPTVNISIYAAWNTIEDIKDESGNTTSSSFEQFIKDQQQNADGTFDEIVINDYETLKAFADYVNAGNDCEGRNFTLGSDITLGSDWTSIGSAGKVFKGGFNGNGNNIVYNRATNSLFGTVEGTVENVNVSGTGTVSGGIADALNRGGVISGCKVLSGTRLSTSSGTLGGIVGTVHRDKGNGKAIVSNCTIEDDVVLAGGANTGGIAGMARGTGDQSAESCTIESCRVGKASISGGPETEMTFGSGTGGLGGILGYGAGYIKDASVSATLRPNGDKAYGIGGIMGTQGETQGCTIIEKSGFEGSIEASEGNRIGGILGARMGKSGQPYTCEIKDVYNTGSISVDIGNAGGILGSNFDEGSVSIENSYYKGTASVGGDFHEIAAGNASNVSVSNSYYYQDADGDISGSMGTAKDEAFFTSGEAAYELNGSRADGPWKQGSGVPSFDGKKVHKVEVKDAQIDWGDGNVSNIEVSSKQFGNEGDDIYMTPTKGKYTFVADGETIEVSVDYVPPTVTNPETGEQTSYTITVKFENSDEELTFTTAGTQSSSGIIKNMSANSTSGSETKGEDEGDGGGQGGGSGSGSGSGNGSGTGDGDGQGGNGEPGDGGNGDDGQGGNQGNADDGNGQGSGGNGNDGQTNTSPNPAPPSVTPNTEPNRQPIETKLESEPAAPQQIPEEQKADKSDSSDLFEQMDQNGGQSGGGEQGTIEPESKIYKIIKKVTETVKENPAATAAILAGIAAIIFFGAWRRKKKEDKE